MGIVNGFEFKATDVKIGAKSKPIVQTTAASSAGRSGTKSKRQIEVGVDGAPSKDNRCNGLIWADMCVREHQVVKDCENAPEGRKRGDKCRAAAKRCVLRNTHYKSKKQFAVAVKKSCHD